LQIILDSLLTFYEVSRTDNTIITTATKSTATTTPTKPTATTTTACMSEHFYPTVVAESVYGSFDVAIHHLNNKLIATRNPEEIRGGGQKLVTLSSDVRKSQGTGHFYLFMNLITEVLKYGTHCQGITQFYLYTHRLNEP